VCYNYNETRHISRFYKKPWKKQNNLTKKGNKKNARISILDANLATGGMTMMKRYLVTKSFKTLKTLVVLIV
jgi:recombinational DNA repair ATPase RecF